MKAPKKKSPIKRAAKYIIPPAAAILALTGCSDSSGSDDDKDKDNDDPNPDNIIDGASFTTPVTVDGLPGQASGFSSYKVFQPALADVDEDGDLDLFAGTLCYNSSSSTSSSYPYIHKVLFFKNNSSEDTIEFSLDTGTFTGLPEFGIYSSCSAIGPMFVGVGDIDMDGDLDMVTSSNSYANSYSSSYTRFALYAANDTDLTLFSDSYSSYQCTAVTLSDIIDEDGDQYVDIIEGKTVYSSSGSSGSYVETSITYSINQEVLFSFGDETTIISSTSPGYSDMWKFPVPSFADLDDDGDQDMFAVTYETGVINYYENTGSADSPEFTSRTDDFDLSPPDGVKWFPAFGDMDGDGDLDAMIGTSDGKILYAENTDIE